MPLAGNLNWLCYGTVRVGVYRQDIFAVPRDNMRLGPPATCARDEVLFITFTYLLPILPPRTHALKNKHLFLWS